LPRGVGELLEQVLVGRSEHVAADLRGGEVQGVEGGHEVEEVRLGQPVLVRPGDVTEDAGERVGIGALDPLEDALDRHPYVLAHLPQICPVAARRQLEAVVVGLNRGRELAVEVLEGSAVLLVPGVGDPLEEQQGEDVGLEVCRIDRAAKRVGGVPQTPFELTLVVDPWTGGVRRGGR
jgi:hypothetical protein